MKYLMVLGEENYTIDLNNDEKMAINDLMQMVDNMINLCQEYGIDDAEIRDNILDDTLYAKYDFDSEVE